MNNEIWKPIPGYESLYEVSDSGHVRSIAFLCSRTGRLQARKVARLLKHETSHDGYKRVVLCKYGKHTHYSVHRIVATTFIPNPHNLSQVNHIDENPANNKADNLEWCTGKENCNHGLHRQRIAIRQTNATHHAKAVNQYTLDGRYIKSFPSTREVERQTGIACEQISRVCKGKNRHAGGFLWKYKTANDNGHG